MNRPGVCRDILLPFGSQGPKAEEVEDNQTQHAEKAPRATRATLLLNGAPIMDDNGLPFVFDHMEVQGRLVGNADEAGNALLKREAQQINAAGSGTRRGEMPLSGGTSDAISILEQALQERFISEVVGAPMAAAAIGGGTDAKGHVALVAAGSLFSLGFGPPRQFPRPDLNEGAPLEDLRLSARILYQIMLDEIADKTTR